MQFDSGYKMLINGTLVEGTAHFDVLNPANEKSIARVPEASIDDLNSAISAARGVFPAWSAKSMDERRAVLIAMGQAVIANAEEFKMLLTREQGKPHHEAAGEVMAAAYWLIETAKLDMPVIINEDSAARYSETRRIPLGVVGAIIPWNFPMALAMFKIAPAILAGNSIVLKPSPFTPLTTLKFAELVKDMLPAGVLNVITGGDALGPLMTSHSGFDKFSFTGSTATGKRVMQSASAHLQRVTLELGGNDPAIVMADVDVAEVAQKLFWAAFDNNGQICIAAKRMYVHKDVYDDLRDAIVAYAKTVKIGDGAEQGTQIGPVNNIRQYERVLEIIQDAKEKGYTFLMGEEPSMEPGYFLPITILDNPPEDSKIVQEEQFGPILPLIKFDDYDDVIARANASDYGLGASVWGKDEDAAFAIAQRIVSGTVWVNEVRHLSPLAAFGGVKQSGLGVEGGGEGLLEYTNAQTLTRKKKKA